MSLEMITVILFLGHQDPDGSISKVTIVSPSYEPLLGSVSLKNNVVLRRIQISKVYFKNEKQ